MVTDPLPGPGRVVLADRRARGHGAEYTAPSGTVTSVASESFGGMADHEPRAEVEVRASWTPLLAGRGGARRRTWRRRAEFLSTAGHLPLPAGVVMMPSRRVPQPKLPETLTAEAAAAPQDPTPRSQRSLRRPPTQTRRTAARRARRRRARRGRHARGPAAHHRGPRRRAPGRSAVDAERAHGSRYSQRAYLLQLRRAGSGTHLIDPIAFGHTDDDGAFVAADLSELRRVIVDAEWVVHAASQDLPCLFEVGLLPTRIFDTLAARAAG